MTECEVCNGPVSTFIAYNHDNGKQTPEILMEDWKADIEAHHARIAALEREREEWKVLFRTAYRYMQQHAELNIVVVDWCRKVEALLRRTEGGT